MSHSFLEGTQLITGRAGSQASVELISKAGLLKGQWISNLITDKDYQPLEASLKWAQTPQTLLQQIWRGKQEYVFFRYILGDSAAGALWNMLQESLQQTILSQAMSIYFFLLTAYVLPDYDYWAS